MTDGLLARAKTPRVWIPAAFLGALCYAGAFYFTGGGIPWLGLAGYFGGLGAIVLLFHVASEPETDEPAHSGSDE